MDKRKKSEAQGCKKWSFIIMKYKSSNRETGRK